MHVALKKIYINPLIKIAFKESNNKVFPTSALFKIIIWVNALNTYEVGHICQKQ